MNDYWKGRDFPDTMNSVTEIMEILKERGMDNQMIFNEYGKMEGMNRIYEPNDLVLIRTYRFEGMADPADNTALYVLEDCDQQVGYIIDIYGSESNYGADFSDFLRKIPTQEQLNTTENRKLEPKDFV